MLILIFTIWEGYEVLRRVAGGELSCFQLCRIPLLMPFVPSSRDRNLSIIFHAENCIKRIFVWVIGMAPNRLGLLYGKPVLDNALNVLLKLTRWWSHKWFLSRNCGKWEDRWGIFNFPLRVKLRFEHNLLISLFAFYRECFFCLFSPSLPFPTQLAS